MPESYQPGQRRPIYGQNHQITENRAAWVQSEAGKFLILLGDEEGHGTDVVIYHPKPGRQGNVSINLTNLTAEELEAMRKIFATAFKWAKPVVERRDKEAQDAWNAGDDSHTRNYRPLPTVVYRKRPESQHSEGLLVGPESLSDSVRDGGVDGGVRGAGTELAEPDSIDGQPKDDSTPSDNT